ncbi:MAG: hypothetical protein LRY51_09080 [Geovibrio sp.]|nr:hypothetical protein [Geovibrio sp.]
MSETLPTNNVIVQQIIMPIKPDFMGKKRLAEELELSEQTIEKWIKDGLLKEGKHFFIHERTIRFFLSRD